MAECGDYDVGYGKPPVETRFKRGQSGNPNGRKKGPTAPAILDRILNKKVEINFNGESKKITILEAILTQIAHKAAAGNPQHIKLILSLIEKKEVKEDQNSNEHTASLEYVRRKLLGSMADQNFTQEETEKEPLQTEREPAREKELSEVLNPSKTSEEKN